MQGEIDVFDADAGAGVIVGIDGERYRFTTAELGAVPAGMGQWVNFVASADGVARNITLARGPSSDGQFDLGRIVQRAFGAIGRHWALYVVGSVVLVGLPSAIAAWGQQDMAFQGLAPSNIIALCLGTLGHVGGGYVLTGLVAVPTLNGFRGKPAPLRETLEAAVRHGLPLFVLGILASLGVFAGMMLLVVPGVILSIWWSVAAACLVAERRGLFESFGRSRRLTAGRRWPVFGLLVGFGVLSLVFTLAVGGVFSALAAGLEPAGFIAAAMLSDALSTTVASIVSAAGIAALYYELRTSKEGDDSDDLAAVFD